jgi:hypothetical protein
VLKGDVTCVVGERGGEGKAEIYSDEIGDLCCKTFIANCLQQLRGGGSGKGKGRCGEGRRGLLMVKCRSVKSGNVYEGHSK